MAISIAQETSLFLMSILIGAGLGAIYDFFRIMRIAFKNSRRAIAVEDVLYLLICTFVTFTFILRDNSGSVRIYILFGEALGFITYYLTIGSLVISCSRGIIKFIYKWLLRPVLFLTAAILDFLLLPFRFLGKEIKKTVQKIKYSLKPVGIMLYNLVSASPAHLNQSDKTTKH